MTPFEMLKYMTMIRGASFRNLNERIMAMLNHTDLENYAHVLVCNLSGGTKRKLNAALALVAL